MIVTRFAPSPTGLLHLGHAYSAVMAHGLARAAGGAGGGRFLIRIDDIDGARSRLEFVTAALDDLAWLGLSWDAPPVVQSARLDHYAAALAALKARGMLYPCFCTRADIAASAAAPHGGPGGMAQAVYPGTCRALDTQAAERRMATETPCWRIDMARAVAEAGPLTWEDAARGTITADPLAHGDVVLARKDAPASYHLASTIDDAALSITDVVRGADLIASTDVHRLLQALLGLPSPRYHHHPLIHDAGGRRLAKRDAAATLAAIRAGGSDGTALAAQLQDGILPIGYSWGKA